LSISSALVQYQVHDFALIVLEEFELNIHLFQEELGL